MKQIKLWTEGEMNILRKMWGSGHTSGGIAKMLGRTRNSIIGRLRDLDLLGKKGHSLPKTRDMHVAGKKFIHMLSTHDCRWPLWDLPNDKLYYCGDLTVEGKPYCEHHCRMAYTKKVA